jgi:hypothetical protein
MGVDPSRISKLGGKGELEHFLQRRIRLVFLAAEQVRDFAVSSSFGVEAGTGVFVFRHQRAFAYAVVVRRPFDVTRRLDRIVQMTLCEDGSMLGVLTQLEMPPHVKQRMELAAYPWSAQRTLPSDG